MQPETAAAGDSQVQLVRKRRVMIVAGEASGDLHGADLVARILERDPRCEIFGIAGSRMRAAGARALIKTEEIAGLGLAELSSTIRLTVAALRRLRAILRKQPPDLLIVIDYAEFNMILAGIAKRAGVPVLYYILPQVWAWRRGRVGKLIRRADRMAVVFPFEAELYRHAGGRVDFVGHPLLDRVALERNRAETLARYGFPPRTRLLAILPGSRRGEINCLLPPMLEAAGVLCVDHDMVPVVVLAPTLVPRDLERAAGHALDIRVVGDDAYSIIGASELALVASGTATLETALLGCPMVIVYRMSPVTYALARMLVKGVDFIGMPNILAGRRLVPELIQSQVNARNLIRAGEPMLSETLHRETAAALAALRNRLGTPGAGGRVADIALEMMA